MTDIHAETAARTANPNVKAATIRGTFEPDGATIAKIVGMKAVIAVPMFWETAKPVTRVRVGKSSW